MGDISEGVADTLLPPNKIYKKKYFNPKICFLSSWKYDPGCSSRIRILIFYPSRIPDPGVKRHRIPDPDPQHCMRIRVLQFSWMLVHANNRIHRSRNLNKFQQHKSMPNHSDQQLDSDSDSDPNPLPGAWGLASSLVLVAASPCWRRREAPSWWNRSSCPCQVKYGILISISVSNPHGFQGGSELTSFF
jgi:hypothetical protein